MSIWNVDDTKALKVMEKADKGDSAAQFWFARYLLMNRDYTFRDDLTPETIERAMHYLRLSATQGSIQGAGAMQLGDLYYDGKILPVDYTEAIMWYRTAYLRGNPPAAFALGECAHYGRGMPIDIVEAIEWYLKAITGLKMAVIRLADMYRAGDFFAADPAFAYSLYVAVFQISDRFFQKKNVKTDEYLVTEERIAAMEKTGEQNTSPPPEEAIGELDAKVRARLNEVLAMRE